LPQPVETLADYAPVAIFLEQPPPLAVVFAYARTAVDFILSDGQLHDTAQDSLLMETAGPLGRGPLWS